MIGIDNFYSGKQENIDYLQNIAVNNFTFIKADICDYGQINSIFQEYSIKYIFHQAAIASVQISIQNPRLTHKVNIEGTLNILEAARNHNVSKVVFASSAAVYGDEPTLPKNELSILKPISPYGYEKMMGEHYLQLYSELYDLDCVALRYFNVYGPRQDPNSEYSGVISIFEDKIKRSEPLVIYGDGEQYRDFIYVKDVVIANINAMKNQTNKFDCFCVGTSKKTTLNELVQLIKNKYQSSSLTTYELQRSGDIRASICDNTKLSNLLNTSNFSQIHDIFTRDQ